jgi:hypothetical protein
VLNGTVVGPGPIGRECVSIDFSHHGDPLDIRHFRVAFSTYQFHRLRPDIFGPAVRQTVPPLAAVPRGRRSVGALLLGGRDLAAGLRASGRQQTALPDVTTGVRALVERYAASTLAAFHRTFYHPPVAPAPPAHDAWHTLQPCVRSPLDEPNDRLLKPEFLQHVVRVLMAQGVRAPDIAALVRTKYEDDHGWGDRWTRMDPRARAEFDVRVFAGLVATGQDSLIDLNCVSAQEKGLCPGVPCLFDLRLHHAALRHVQASLEPDPPPAPPTIPTTAGGNPAREIHA